MKPKLIFKHESLDLELTILFSDNMEAERFLICGNADHDVVTDEAIAAAADFQTPEGFKLTIDATGAEAVYH